MTASSSMMSSSRRGGNHLPQPPLSIPEEDEMGSPGSRRVRFPEKRPTLEITRRISRVSTRALSEITAMWGDDQEEKERKARLRRDLERLADGECSEEFDELNGGSGLCTLGLADKIGSRAEEKLAFREKAWDAVMWNQHDQWEEQQNCDYEQVAKVYSEGAQTLEVQEKAQKEAKKLESEIDDVRNDPEVKELLQRSSIHSQSSVGSSSTRSAMKSPPCSPRLSIGSIKSIMGGGGGGKRGSTSSKSNSSSNSSSKNNKPSLSCSRQTSFRMDY